MGNKRQRSWGHRLKRHVHNGEMQTLEVRNVARNVERQDLTIAITCKLRCTNKAIHHKATASWAIALAHENETYSNLRKLHWNIEKPPLFVRGELIVRVEFQQKSLSRRHLSPMV